MKVAATWYSQTSCYQNTDTVYSLFFAVCLTPIGGVCHQNSALPADVSH